MNIIEDLWYGNISPWERPFKKDSAYAELLALVVRHQEDLLSRLNDEEKDIFENMLTAQLRCTIFQNAKRLRKDL